MQEPKFALDTGPKFDLGGSAGFVLGDGPPAVEPLTAEDATAEVEKELSEVLTGFRDRAARENQRFTEATDSEYWVAVCFQTRAQKEEFLQKMGWSDLGDKYLDGMEVAEAAGIQLESHIPAVPKLKIDRKLISLAQDFT